MLHSGANAESLGMGLDSSGGVDDGRAVGDVGGGGTG